MSKPTKKYISTITRSTGVEEIEVEVPASLDETPAAPKPEAVEVPATK